MGGHRVHRVQDWLSATDLERLVKRSEVNASMREGATISEVQRMKELEREVKELRRANEVLKLTSSLFGQAELYRRLKS